ncbi:HNH endonuclease [Rhizobium leguminosarum]|uniref:HNH endonuclease n=1 Tax=Rhizobium leguminosarum TaxID=384 RepID=UPI0012F89B22|nr:HNH endonuclease signature motif containing protein [Rhizobium leguminosarum]MVO95113.1 hypothetical protein [Rhizobium leguminosarum bv. phaseoli]
MSYAFPPPLKDFFECLRADYKMCVVCHSDFIPDTFNGPTVYEQVGVCQECCRNLYALYAYQHSGDYDGIYPSPLTPKPRRPKISRAMALRVIGKSGYQCQKCGTRDHLEIDHIIPLARGGDHVEDNMQALCATCNRSKGARV